MQKIVLLLWIQLLAFASHACSIYPDTFCESLVERNSDHVFLGVILSIDNQGLHLSVLEVLRGSESRDTIRVWNGRDFDCNGNWSMAVNTMGSVGDTIISMLPMIQYKENRWDVIGDYRRPNPYTNTTELRYRAGRALGFIQVTDPPFPQTVRSMNYQRLRDSLINFGACRAMTNSASEPLSADIQVSNPVTERAFLHGSYTWTRLSVELYNADGKFLLSQKLEASERSFDTSSLPAGVYHIVLIADDKRRHVLRLVKV